MIGYKPSLPHLDARLCDAIVQRIVSAVGAQKVVLFGSRARGTHRPDSDVDLLVVNRSTEPRYKRSVPIYAALADLPIEVNADVIVYTPEEIAEWSEATAAFVTTALREGQVLYER
jgi:predicted nucleotidyltransferase